jgi:hypothetical protein
MWVETALQWTRTVLYWWIGGLVVLGTLYAAVCVVWRRIVRRWPRLGTDHYRATMPARYNEDGGSANPQTGD